MHPKDLERRLVHEHLGGLGDHARDGADGIAHGCMLGHEQLPPEAPCDFGIIRSRGGADGDQRGCQVNRGIEEPGERAPGSEILEQNTERSPMSVLRLDARVLGQ